MERTRLQAGTELNGVFVIDQLVATGGMGEVYRGHSIQTGDKVAIKVIRSDLAESDTALALFRKEASALYNLNHEAIARFFLFSVDPVIQRAYLAMEFIEGTSIEDMIASGAPLTVADVAIFSRRVALGLNAAHEMGITHRDISPDNIILASGDVRKAKLIDFGIARSTRLGNTTVIGGGFAGKYNFVSPEQLGLFGGDVGATSDIYSLGLVMAAALRGRPLDMSGSQVDVINKRRAVPGLADVDPRFATLIARMLEPDPASRPQSVLEVADWCEQLGGTKVASTTTGAAQSPMAPRDWSRPAREPVAKQRPVSRRLIVGGIAAFALAGTFWVLYPTRPPPPKGTPAAPSVPAPGPAIPVPNGDVTSRVRRFIEDYDGGNCFKITPLVVDTTMATIDGIGPSAEPFSALDQAFKAAFGFEANIEFKTVTPSQCSAVSFLGRNRFNPAFAPRIDINVTELRNGQAVTGTVSARRDLQLEVLLVREDGFVQNVTGMLRSSNQRSFNIMMDRPASASPKPQLLIALATTRPVPALTLAKPAHADQLFPSILAELRELGMDFGAAFQYVVVN